MRTAAQTCPRYHGRARRIPEQHPRDSYPGTALEQQRIQSPILTPNRRARARRTLCATEFRFVSGQQDIMESVKRLRVGRESAPSCPRLTEVLGMLAGKIEGYLGFRDLARLEITCKDFRGSLTWARDLTAGPRTPLHRFADGRLHTLELRGVPAEIPAGLLRGLHTLCVRDDMTRDLQDMLAGGAAPGLRHFRWCRTTRPLEVAHALREGCPSLFSVLFEVRSQDMMRHKARTFLVLHRLISRFRYQPYGWEVPGAGRYG